MSKAVEPRIVVIGAGMAGILSLIKLREAGYRDVVAYEKADRIGGTWRENTYPGVACDVPSHLYTYSFEPNPDWSRRFPPGAEIQRYFERVVEKYDVAPAIRFSEAVEVCEFTGERWRIRTSRGREDEADVVIAATGVLHQPFVADISGLDAFAGACFHSARWDHDVELAGQRVGVVGTGSSAVQITSALIPKVGRLDLFQRTAQWICPIDDQPYTEEEKALFRSDPSALDELKARVNEYFVKFSEAVIDAESDAMKEIEAVCLANLENSVRDPVLREKLRPNYRAGCKRLIFSSDFYEAIQRPNARLITDPIARVEARGVRLASGELRELDVLVMATGFRADRFIRPTVVKGRDGIELDEVWADRPVAYLSVALPQFPNFFLVNGPNGPVGNFSLILIAENQLHYILQLIDRIRAGECRTIEPRVDVSTQFEAERIAAAKNSIWATGCSSWYLDRHGVPASWPWSRERFLRTMERPAFEDYERAG